jgi:hypothetical protein
VSKFPVGHSGPALKGWWRAKRRGRRVGTTSEFAEFSPEITRKNAGHRRMSAAGARSIK